MWFVVKNLLGGCHAFMRKKKKVIPSLKSSSAVRIYGVDSDYVGPICCYRYRKRKIDKMKNGEKNMLSLLNLCGSCRFFSMHDENDR